MKLGMETKEAVFTNICKISDLLISRTGKIALWPSCSKPDFQLSY